MRVLAFFLGLLVLGAGCVSNHPTPTARQIAIKREEIKERRQQIDGLTRVLNNISQEDLSGKSAEAQARDLDQILLALRQAEARLATECRRLHDEYHWEGPY